MGDIAKGILLNLWTALAVGAVIGFALATLIIYIAYLLQKNRRVDESGLHAAMQQRQQLLLLCGDARVLADLAIQRHVTDTDFLRHLRAQPCYAALSPFFSETFRRQVKEHPEGSSRTPLLAVACRTEIDQLEKAIGMPITARPTVGVCSYKQ